MTIRLSHSSIFNLLHTLKFMLIKQERFSQASDHEELLKVFDKVNTLLAVVDDENINDTIIDCKPVAELVRDIIIHYSSPINIEIQEQLAIAFSELMNENLLRPDDNACLMDCILATLAEQNNSAAAIDCLAMYNALQNSTVSVMMTVDLQPKIIYAIKQIIYALIRTGDLKELQNTLADPAILALLTEDDLTMLVPDPFNEMLPLSTHIEIFKVSSPNPKVAILMGSDSDWPMMKPAAEMLAKLGIPFEVKLLSAHRTPELVPIYTTSAETRGIEVIIAGAGGAAALPGALASFTLLPVMGVPLSPASMPHLRGKDALYSIVQMPDGIPVMTVGIDRARNGALAAARVLALKYPEIHQALAAHREEMRSGVMNKSRIFSQTGWQNYSEPSKKQILTSFKDMSPVPFPTTTASAANVVPSFSVLQGPPL